MAATPVFRKCRVPNCGEEIEAPKLFCERHWGMIPKQMRVALFDALIDFQSRDFVEQILRRALAAIAEIERQIRAKERPA